MSATEHHRPLLAPRVAALFTMLAAVVLLGAAVATWSTVTIAEPFGAEGTGEELVIERIETIDGPAVAGGLVALGLAAFIPAGLLVRWRRAGLLLLPLAAGSAVLTIAAWPDRGEVSAAPAIVLTAAVALAGIGAAVNVRRRTATPPDRAGPRPAPSRYTVEAAAGIDRPAADPADPAAGVLDEWDAAVAEDDA